MIDNIEETPPEASAPEAAPAPRRRARSSRLQKVTATPVAAAQVDKSDSLKRAEARTAELLEHNEDGGGVDKFYIDPNVIPEGWVYQWKRQSVMGKTDPSYAVQLQRGGWEGVPSDRHPEMMPFGWKEGNAIERDGMILMERPQTIDERRRAQLARDAQNQVRQKREQLALPGSGQFGRDNKGQSLVDIRSHGFEPIPVPKHD